MVEVAGWGVHFFKLLNFFILVGIAIYFFKTRLHGQCLQRMAQSRVSDDSRNARAQELFAQAGRLRDAILQDKQFFIRIKESIAVWGQAVELRHEETVQERLALVQKADERQQVRQKAVDIAGVRRAVMPDAIQEVTQILKTRFNTDEARRRYLTTIITRMKRDT